MQRFMTLSTRMLLPSTLVFSLWIADMAAGTVYQQIFSVRPLRSWEAASAVGGDIYGQACQVVGTGTCPSGAIPNPETQCAPSTIAGCLVNSCTNCNAAAGTALKLCFTFPETSCQDNPSGGWLGASTCGTQTSAGCNLKTFPAAACFCPGGYVPTSWDCPQSDCLGTDFNP